jgi:ligand-binding sensor domain-containing protein/signal transduction histidine kinase
MAPRPRPFILALCLAIFVTLPGLACSSSPIPKEIPVEQGAPVQRSADSSAPPAAAYSPPAQDETSTIRFDRLSAQDGLSQNGVLTIWQDRIGFMWFGTEDGLNKYDGYDFTVYTHDPDDESTISDNLVSVIHEDQDGVLWLGTKSGLDRFDRTSGTFSHYRNDPDDAHSLGGEWVVAMYEDREGVSWVGTNEGGLDRFDRAAGTFTHYRHDPDDTTSLADDAVGVITEDGDGTLWVGTDGGLNRFDRSTGTFHRYQHTLGDLHSLGGNEVSAIVEDNRGALWIGTEDGGLNRFDRDTETFVRYEHDPDDPSSLSHNRVRQVFEDSTGRLWIGTQNGLDLYDAKRDRFFHFQHNPSDPYSLSSNPVWAIYEDRTGVLWFATYGGGLNKYNRTTDQFTLYQHNPDLPNSLSENMVWSITQDRDGAVWIGTFNGGLNRLDRESGTFTVYRHDPEDPHSLGSDDVRALLEDKKGDLWIGTNGGGLNRFDRRRETFTHYQHDPDDPNSLSEDRVTTLLEDRSGRLWIGTRTQGMNRLDPGTGTFDRYTHDPDDPYSLSDDRVWALTENNGGALWVGTLGGISVLDVNTNRFTRYLNNPDDPYSLGSDAIFAFHQDLAGTMWIGTWGGGLDRFDPATQTFSHYTEKNGLPDNVIYGIEADSVGCLWMSTNKGLVKFDPRSETFRTYDLRDGLQDNEFNWGAHYTGAHGEMFFGGIQGLNAFFPEQVTGNPHVPPVVVTSFSKLNRTVRTDLAPGEQIQLSYRDDFISFEFAALDYTAPDKNQYRYMLEGQDADWVEAGSRRHVDYTNLKGGDYVFRVKGSNNDGVWNEEGATVYLTVVPPVWETWWFRGAALLLLVGALIGGYRLRVRSIEERSRELEVQVAERTREIERRTQELEALYRADEEVLRYLELDQVLETLVDVAVDILGADKGSILAWDTRGDRLVVKAAQGFKAETLAQTAFEVGEGVVGHVAASGEPAVVEDTHEDARIARRFTDPEGIRSLMHVPIKVGGQVFGVFNVNYGEPRAFDQDDVRLFTALAQRAALAIENAQLYAQAQELAVVQERQRLARDLHDAVTQTLFSSSLIAEVLPRLWERDADLGRQRLEEVRELTRGALAEMRTLLLELRPKALLEANLGDLLRQLAAATTGRARVPVEVTIEGDYAGLSPDVKIALYRIAQEALNNVAKHARASQARIRLCCGPDVVELCIADDGQGFDPSQIPPNHLGVGIMHERAAAIDAQLTVESEIGEGTSVRVVWSEL